MDMDPLPVLSARPEVVQHKITAFFDGYTVGPFSEALMRKKLMADSFGA